MTLSKGDVIAVPLDASRCALIQVVETYMNQAFYFSVFDRAVSRDAGIVEAAPSPEDRVVLLALSLDAKVVVGDWRVIGSVRVLPDHAPLPVYVEGVSPPGTFDVVDATGHLRRPATSDEIQKLKPRKIVAPIRVEKAARALHGLASWEPALDELRVPATSTPGEGPVFPQSEGER